MTLNQQYSDYGFTLPRHIDRSALNREYSVKGLVINMKQSIMEKAFSDFLDGDTYEKAEASLFDLVRAAFRAGWDAALSSTEDND